MTIDRFIPDDKGVGLIVATAVGDALGWPQEDRSNIVGGEKARAVPPEPNFRGWSRNAGTQFGRYLDPVLPGEYSDDTQLMLAVARACMHEDWLSWLTHVELPTWPLYQRGGGGAVLNAARSWADHRPPWAPANARAESKVTRYFDAGANGVAMRIAPHALVTASQDTDDELIRRVILDGITTHGHPRALVGAAIHALGIRHALRHEGTLGYGELIDVIAHNQTWRDPSTFATLADGQWLESHERWSTGDTRVHPYELWGRTVDEVDHLLDLASAGLSRGATANDERVLESLGVFDKKQSGSGTVCAVAAMYVATRTAPRPMGGLLRTGFLRRADTDTLCSMTGSLLGSLHGPGWLGALFQDVQDRDYLVKVGLDLSALANHAAKQPHAPRDEPVATATGDLRKWTKDLFDGEPVHIAPDGRRSWVESIDRLETRTRNFVARARIHTEDGQTLIVDRISKTPLAAFADSASNTPDHAANNSRRATTDVGTSNERRQPAPSVSTVELRVANLDASTRFFAQVLGFDCEGDSRRTYVNPFLVLSASGNAGANPDPLATIVTVSHPDPEQVAHRAESFGGVRYEWSRDRGALWLKEPGNNVIRVVRMATDEGARPTSGASASEHPLAVDMSMPPAPTRAEETYMQDALFDVSDANAPSTPGEHSP